MKLKKKTQRFYDVSVGGFRWFYAVGNSAIAVKPAVEWEGECPLGWFVFERKTDDIASEVKVEIKKRLAALKTE